MLKIAFAGFRHGHIIEVVDLAAERDDVQVVAACEEDPATREQFAGGKVRITHTGYDALFGVDFDILAIGDYYGRRGSLAIRALESGKHVIADKPLCTSVEELEQVAALAAEHRLCVGCQLSMRDSGNFIALRQLIAEGTIGEVHTVTFSGQHPLMPGKRPGWYFEEGKQGGTINDIGVHAVDLIPWLTGRRIVSAVAARAWNARAMPAFFQDGAQMMLRLDNGGGVLGDVSYLAPDACGYKTPQYWRFTVHGSGGAAETNVVEPGVMVWKSDSAEAVKLPPAKDRRGGYFDSFLSEIAGRTDGLTLTTGEVIDSTRRTLLIQAAADSGQRDVEL